MDCPCGTGREFEQCCAPFLEGAARPQTAEQLMRSRYTAHVRGAVAYVEKTWAPETKKAFDAKTVETWSRESKWKGLKVLRTDKGGPGDTKGVVEFVATYEKQGKGIEHHEVSRFRKAPDGQWLFVDGDGHEHAEGQGHHHHHHDEPKGTPYVRDQAKVGRNDPCGCGSGKKFKKCCGS